MVSRQLVDSLLGDFWWQGVACSSTGQLDRGDPPNPGKYNFNLKSTKYSQGKLSGWLECDFDRHISAIFPANLRQISRKSHKYLRHMSGILQTYLSHILDISPGYQACQSNLSCILGISQLSLSHILWIYQAYISHIKISYIKIYQILALTDLCMTLRFVD